MTRGKAEDAGGLTPAKDDNAAPYHFDRRTLPIFKCVDYNRPARSAGLNSRCVPMHRHRGKEDHDGDAAVPRPLQMARP